MQETEKKSLNPKGPRFIKLKATSSYTQAGMQLAQNSLFKEQIFPP